MAVHPHARKCVRDGCKNWAIHGGTVCRIHGGAAPQIKALAAVRAELETWCLGDAVDNPGQVLLRLITQSRRRVDALGAALDAMIEKAGGDLQKALVGETLVTTKDGDVVQVGEYYRVIADQEGKERDRLSNFCAKAIAAGLAERMVHLAEKEATMAHVALCAGLDEAGITGETRTRVLMGVARHFRQAS